MAKKTRAEERQQRWDDAIAMVEEAADALEEAIDALELAIPDIDFGW